MTAVEYGTDYTCEHGEPPDDCPKCPPPHEDMWAGALDENGSVVVDIRTGAPSTEVVDQRPLYVDVAALLAGGLPEPPQPLILKRQDGHCLFYKGKVNVLFGDPESGKTWVALAAIADVLANHGNAAFIDLDHNGATEIIGRLLYLGATPRELGDPDRFRLAEPEDSDEMVATVLDVARWAPDIVVVDSLGELLPLMGASSNSPDDWTAVNRRTLTRLAAAGSAVVAVDHLPKSPEARAAGQTGTIAKKRSINGASYRVYAMETFAPGQGGACGIDVEKDRPGGVRQHCPASTRGSQKAGVFRLTHRFNGTGLWSITAPVDNDADNLDTDVEALAALVPPPTSKRDVQDRLKWGSDRAYKTLKRWRDQQKDAPTEEGS